MKFTQVRSDTFQSIQLNAGIILTDFTPSTGAFDESDILGATSGGATFAAVPTFIDFGADIDNVPENTFQLKQFDQWQVTMSGTFVAVDGDLAELLTAAGDLSSGKVTPRTNITSSDFSTVWWVGDYSDVTNGGDAGFIAIEMTHALSTGGFKVKSNDKGKGTFDFEFTAHYDLEDIDTAPFNIYVHAGQAPDATLSALTIGSVTLSPTFAKNTTSYTAATTSSTNTITATPTDNTATVVIKNGSTTITSGNSATWTTGENTVTVTVTNGDAVKVYTVVVTKS